MTTKYDLGDVVLCDMCNKDFSNLPDKGGIVFGSKAVCPDCTPQILKNARKYDELEYIKAYCPDDMSFADWVRNVLRGGRNATMEIISFDDWIY